LYYQPNDKNCTYLIKIKYFTSSLKNYIFLPKIDWICILVLLDMKTAAIYDWTKRKSVTLKNAVTHTQLGFLTPSLSVTQKLCFCLPHQLGFPKSPTPTSLPLGA
jgi:hypothetical protein